MPAARSHSHWQPAAPLLPLQLLQLPLLPGRCCPREAPLGLHPLLLLPLLLVLLVTQPHQEVLAARGQALQVLALHLAAAGLLRLWVPQAVALHGRLDPGYKPLLLGVEVACQHLMTAQLDSPQQQPETPALVELHRVLLVLLPVATGSLLPQLQLRLPPPSAVAVAAVAA